MKKTNFLFGLLFALSLLLNTELKAQTNMGVNDFVSTYKATKNAQLLDVRSPGEWAGGKIASSATINFYDAAFKQKIEKLDKKKPIFVYCAVGGRSTQASKVLQASGFKVYNLQGGGYNDLARLGIK